MHTYSGNNKCVLVRQSLDVLSDSGVCSRELIVFFCDLYPVVVGGCDGLPVGQKGWRSVGLTLGLLVATGVGPGGEEGV